MARLGLYRIQLQNVSSSRGARLKRAQVIIIIAMMERHVMQGTYPATEAEHRSLKKSSVAPHHSVYSPGHGLNAGAGATGRLGE